MKRITTTMVIVLMICGFTIQAQAQEDPKNQMAHIHSDHVMPSKSMQYEASIKTMVAALKKHNISDVSFLTFSQSNGDYIFASTMENYAELDKNLFAGLKEKMSDAEWDAMWKSMQGTYLSHEDYIATFMTDLSYKVETRLAEGMNYRVWDFYYFEDKDLDNMLAVSKKWKELYESKKVGGGYSIYTSGFGMEGPAIVVYSWGKNEADYAAQSQKDNETLGEEADKLSTETMQYIYKRETITGWYKADLSYQPAK